MDYKIIMYRYGTIGLAIVIMYDLTQQEQHQQETTLYTKTWPSLQDFKQHYYPLWFGSATDSKNLGEQLTVSEEMNRWLKGTAAYETMEKYAT